MAIRVDVNSLSDEVRKSLERGEVVEIEQDGEVVARIPPSRPSGGLRGFLELRLQDEPVDEDFERDLATARELINETVVTEPWES
jgi:antitoxin (DNA-binding transcriptional repressor) of toxin-antitoxin stability system